MKVRICVALRAKTFSDLVSLIKRAEDAGADLIEVRLDYMDADPLNALDRLEKVIKQSSVPFIATNRQFEQGGHRPQDEEERARTLVRAAEVGFSYIDTELTTAKLKPTIEKIKGYGAKTIISSHNLDGTPNISEMEKTVRAQIEAGPGICKLITTAKDVEDNVKCMLVARKMSRITKVVCFAMGSKGMVSRVFSPLFGAYFTYASLEGGLETASGQLTIADLRGLYERLGVNG